MQSDHVARRCDIKWPTSFPGASRSAPRRRNRASSPIVSSSIGIKRPHRQRVRPDPLHRLHVTRHIVSPRGVFPLERLDRGFRQDVPMTPPRAEKGEVKPTGEIVRVDEIPSGDLVFGVVCVEVGVVG